MILGITVGWFVESINVVIQWITAALWGGYTASNVLKWYWWRFNGYGYFWGMVAGIGALARAARSRCRASRALNSFPIILVARRSSAASPAPCSRRPEDDEVLKTFYRKVRPWGFWGPILAKVQAEDPAFQPNHDFWRDMFNIVVGIVLADEPRGPARLHRDPQVERRCSTRGGGSWP